MLLRVKKGQENRLVVTLTELVNLLSPINWLFRFTNDQGSKEYALFLTDISTSSERFNLFVLEEGTDVTFTTLGDYKYQCYQMPDTNDTDHTRGTLVETGKAVVFVDDTATPTFTPTNNEAVFNG